MPPDTLATPLLEPPVWTNALLMNVELMLLHKNALTTISRAPPPTNAPTSPAPQEHAPPLPTFVMPPPTLAFPAKPHPAQVTNAPQDLTAI